MNVTKIFEALKKDDQNSALGIITAELNAQGYSVSIDGKPVEADGFFEGNYPELENEMGPLVISLFKNDNFEQEFCAEFTDFHELVIKSRNSIPVTHFRE